MAIIQPFEQVYFETFCQVRNSAIVIFDLPTKQLTYKRQELNYKTYSGKVTTHAAKRIKKAVDLLVQVSKPTLIYNDVIQRHIMHTLSFITLTISAKEQHITASQGHELLLQKWILRMKRKAGLNTYIWKAELQKNGQLHYHITTPSWINYTLIRDEWNNILAKAGLKKTWDESSGKIQNSTDVHAVYKVKDLAAYLCKYLSKEDKEQSTKGKIWDCSLNLKRSKLFTVNQPSDFKINSKEIKVKDCERCTMIFTANPIYHFSNSIQRQYQLYLNAVLHFKRDNAKDSFTNLIAINGGIPPSKPKVFQPIQKHIQSESPKFTPLQLALEF